MKLAHFQNVLSADNFETAIAMLNAKFEIEKKWKVTVVTIEPEDGSGKKYNVTTKENPGKKYFVNLNDFKK